MLCIWMLMPRLIRSISWETLHLIHLNPFDPFDRLTNWYPTGAFGHLEMLRCSLQYKLRRFASPPLRPNSSLPELPRSLAAEQRRKMWLWGMIADMQRTRFWETRQGSLLDTVVERGQLAGNCLQYHEGDWWKCRSSRWCHCLKANFTLHNLTFQGLKKVEGFLCFSQAWNFKETKETTKDY